MSDYLSAVEAGEFLGCSETAVRNRILSGDLPADKEGGRWRILRSDLDGLTFRAPRSRSDQIKPNQIESNRTRSNIALEQTGSNQTNSNQTEAERVDPDTAPDTAWRDDLLGQIADQKRRADRAEMSVDGMRADFESREFAASRREEVSKARIIDLERELMMRDSRVADMQAAHDSRIMDMQAERDTEVTELRGQVAILEAKVREVLEAGKDEALQLAKGNADLANRIADLVTAHEDMYARVVELQPVAEQVPMLQAAVEEKDASLSERERELGNMRNDIDAIASRPVTGPVFRLLTKGKLRR